MPFLIGTGNPVLTEAVCRGTHDLFMGQGRVSVAMDVTVLVLVLQDVVILGEGERALRAELAGRVL